MVFVKFQDESDKDLLQKLNIDLKGHKFGLVPYKTLLEKVDSHNKEKKNQKLLLNEIIKPDMIYMQADMESLEREEADNDPKVIKEREERQARIEERKYQKMMGKDKGQSIGADIRDMEKSISFGVSFIFTFFLSGVSGYFIGKHILEWNEGLCMILAVVSLIGTLILESTLFIVKTWKNDKIAQEKQKHDKQLRQQMRNTESQEITKLILEFQKNKEKTLSQKKND
ncbi:endoplasmic reticulum-based factor for assembly of V-ATPase (macronuclear) [Tetrahymena thermophila SB210]|uniref:Endoplasmic reticulum-based factor for assembly of V-ATPase n=1 Tax=Tetrahymena thermophila (strain SB210) TaxID=312017 RepID=Q23ME8_TETTS|nr:endoplasmic reticulum-based factor for assembly of V-ATPase [Tetrahymena thermophila SB210]EAR97691.2 endoplasmic reticulum-based factor for assembly of V-ATPase [Tetrahymena thermophila SB210]|eukprot:XP_001017936.2 endoplasmic reticulum-based factor for assembly of V-ATPase [Tetrahymena thermophila SB210]